MFSIKQVTSRGEENFWEARDLSVRQRFHGDDRPEGYPRFPDWDDRIIRFYQPMLDGSSVECSIDEGQVFIMNATGKTIDRYTLGQQPPRHPYPSNQEFAHLPHADVPPTGQGAGVRRDEVPSGGESLEKYVPGEQTSDTEAGQSRG